MNQRFVLLWLLLLLTSGSAWRAYQKQLRVCIASGAIVASFSGDAAVARQTFEEFKENTPALKAGVRVGETYTLNNEVKKYEPLPPPPLQSDELAVTFDSYVSGLSLKEQAYKTSKRVIIKGLQENSEAASKEGALKKDYILVSAAGRILEGQSLKKVADVVANTPRPITLTFRDPTKFFALLNSAVSDSELRKEVTTSVRPQQSDGTSADILKIERVYTPPLSQRTRSAIAGDVLEIKLSTKVMTSTGLADVSFDTSEKIPEAKASSLKAVEEIRLKEQSEQKTDREINGDSIFFVLGAGNSEKFKLPVGVDLGLRGVVVGEKRVINIPPSLGLYEGAGDSGFEIGLSRDASSAQGKDMKIGQLLVTATVISLNGFTE